MVSEIPSELIVELDALNREPGTERFYVRLDASPIEALIKAAQNAHRLHELLLIERPGDIWAYVWVVLENIPASLNGRLKFRDTTQPSWLEDLFISSSTQRVPFNVFNSIFVPGSEDVIPEEDAWLSQRAGPAFSGFAKDLLEAVNAASGSCRRRTHYLGM